jgi:hypothetical protein
MCKFSKEYFGVEDCGEEAEALMERHRIESGRSKDEEHLRRLQLIEELRKFDLGLTQTWIRIVKQKIQEKNHG